MRSTTALGACAALAITIPVITSCGIVGVMSDTNVYSYRDEIICRGAPTTYADKFIDATRPSGFSVSGRGPNSISVSRQGSGAMTVLIGKVDRIDIIASWPTGRVIKMELGAHGNLGAGDEASVQRYVADIKSRLAGC